MRQTCQFNGGFYTEEARRILMPALVKALAEGTPDVKAFETVARPATEAKQAS
jgi:hypothetical protein